MTQGHEILSLGLIWASLKHVEARFSKFWFLRGGPHMHCDPESQISGNRSLFRNSNIQKETWHPNRRHPGLSENVWREGILVIYDVATHSRRWLILTLVKKSEIHRRFHQNQKLHTRVNCRVFGITAQFIQQMILHYLLLRLYMVCCPKLNREYPKMHSLLSLWFWIKMTLKIRFKVTT